MRIEKNSIIYFEYPPIRMRPSMSRFPARKLFI